jgi:hypothetical protein
VVLGKICLGRNGGGFRSVRVEGFERSDSTTEIAEGLRENGE